MANGGEKDYTRSGFGITALVLALLICVMAIEGRTVGGVTIKRANILSDLVDLGPRSVLVPVAMEHDEQQMLLAESTVPEQQAAPVSSPHEEPLLVEPLLAEPVVAEEPAGRIEVVESAEASSPEAEFLKGGNVVAIEDFGQGEGFSMDDFYRILESQSSRRPVRVAVLGDSFIEGDIFVADVREQLQKLYSGSGVGFVPFASSVSQYRATIKHTHSGWKTYTTLNVKSLPEEIKGRFFTSCLISQAQDGAKSRFAGSGFRKNLKRSQVATMLFTNEEGSTIHVTVNDSLRESFTPEASPLPQSIRIEGAIDKFEVEIENPQGFYGYGVAFEGRRGVVVDNYSLRGNSGLALFGTTYDMNRRMDRLRRTDLIILEYGLNVVSADVVHYNYYRGHLVRIINFLKACYPQTAILVMGVADRSTQENGEFVTMAGVEPMIAAQRKAAKECEVAFWNTYVAMGGSGSMSRFVEKEWAAKDYTHIGFAGGRVIAKSFARALVAGKLGYEQRAQVEKMDTLMMDLSNYRVR